jgi:hypothetical protein
MTLAGTVQAGTNSVSGVNLYRSTDNFATWTKVNGSTLISVSAGAFSFTDSTASNCVATNSGGGTTNPQSGAPALWWPATSYRYKAAAVDSQGVEGPWSASHKMYVYNFNSGGQNIATVNGSGKAGGGIKWNQDDGGGTFVTSYNDTGSNETGRSILVSDSGTYWLLFCGNIYPQWTMWAGGTDYFYIDINFATVGNLTLHAEMNPNDHKIAPSGHTNGDGISTDLTAYLYAVNGVVDNRWPNVPFSAIPAGQWCTFKVPRADFMTDAGTLQGVVYKFLINKWGGSIGSGTRFDKIFYGP